MTKKRSFIEVINSEINNDTFDMKWNLNLQCVKHPVLDFHKKVKYKGCEHSRFASCCPKYLYQSVLTKNAIQTLKYIHVLIFQVLTANGDEGFVPALCCILPTPDKTALTATER